MAVSFTIIDEPAEGMAVERFTLYNAATNEELFELQDGHVVDLQEIGTNEINIRAYTQPQVVGSVEFSLTGAQNYTHTENFEAYALYANAGEDFFSWEPALGNYQLTATPYSEAHAQGEAGTALSLGFSIVNTTEDNLRTVNVYPNPGTDVLNIPIYLNGNSRIIILDLAGKEIKVKDNSSLQGGGHVSLDVSGLEKKAYIIKIIGANEVKTLRWVKQ